MEAKSTFYFSEHVTKGAPNTLFFRTRSLTGAKLAILPIFNPFFSFFMRMCANWKNRQATEQKQEKTCFLFFSCVFFLFFQLAAWRQKTAILFQPYSSIFVTNELSWSETEFLRSAWGCVKMRFDEFYTIKMSADFVSKHKWSRFRA